MKYATLNNQARPCLNRTSFLLSEFDIEECIKLSCPLECDTVSYEYSLSTVPLFTKNTFASLTEQQRGFYQRILGNETILTYDLVKSLFTRVRVFYPSLEYTDITESPQTSIFDLFTQIGGSLGLFISFSVSSSFFISTISSWSIESPWYARLNEFC